MNSISVAIICVLIIFAILAFDAYLYADGVEGNSISQIIIKWTKEKQVPFIPWLIGLIMGFLGGHLFG
jgi:hypothetical protein